MRTTLNRREAGASGARASRPLPTRPRLRGQALTGAIVILLSALVFALLYVNAGDRTSVVTLRGELPVGQVLQQSDLAATQVAGVRDAVPYAERDRLVGKTTAVGMVSGQILTDEMVTATPVPGRDQVLLGLSLTRSQIPGSGVKAGDRVRLVKVTGPEEVSASADDVATLVDEARVYAVTRPDSSTGQVSSSVTVVVPEADSEALAGAAAAGQVALLKLAAGSDGS